METKDIILELRKKNKLSQDELAKKVMVTRQAVSRWENGETIPNTETLKLLSKEFNVSINTFLGNQAGILGHSMTEMKAPFYRLFQNEKLNIFA